MNKTDIKRCIFFGVFFCILCFMFGQIYANIIMSSSILSKIDKQFYNFQNDIKYLVMGDSHGQYSIDPRILGDSFNFSTASGSYIHTYYKLKYIIDKTDKHIAAIILPVDMHSFSSANYDVPSNSWYWRKYIDYMQLGKNRGKVAVYVLDYLSGFFTPYIGKRDFILRFFDEEKDSRDIFDGYIPIVDDILSTEEISENAKARSKYFFYNRKHIDKVLKAYFLEIIKLCQKNDINVKLIRFPVTECYQNEITNYFDENFQDKIDLIIKEVVKIDPKISYLDASSLYFGEKSLFKDSDHLNREGAILFSNYIKKWLKENG